MRHINPVKAAISVGAVIGAYHLAWAALVASGVAKTILDFVLKLQFLQFDYQLMPFSVGTAATLVGLTFAIGSAFGFVFAIVWNWLASRGEPRAAPSSVRAAA